MSHAEVSRPARPRRALRRWWVVAVLAMVTVALGAAGVVALPWWQDANLPPLRTKLAAGSAHTCVVTPDGGVKCWGDNHFGQLGDGSTTPSASPVDVEGLRSGVLAVTGSGNHTCALTGTGAVTCWGANESGQLGNGTTEPSPVPREVGGLGARVLQVSAGAGHTCALTDARAVLCWGANGTHELGTGDTTSSTTPVGVRDLPARSTLVDVGSGFTCVVFTGRTVRCWGDNGDGQLGVGDRAGRARWEPVPALARSSVLVVGDAHACALTREGVVDCWGANWAGQLGISLASPGSTHPIGVPGLPSGVTALSAGYNQTCALAAGSVTCWGGITDAASAEHDGPRPVAGLTAVEEVSVGTFHACALTAGAVSCWGANPNGQLGDGTTSSSDAPVAVVGL